MRRHDTRRRTVAWLATLGIALNALWPALADAMRDAPVDPLTELCTAVPGDSSSRPASPSDVPYGKRHHAQHCTLCTAASDHAALPLSADLVVAAADGDEPRLGTHDILPSRDDSYLTAPSRAPPFLF